MSARPISEQARSLIKTNPELAREIARQLTPPLALTPRQAKLLGFIRQSSAEHGQSPSYSEMAEAIGVSSKSRIKDLVEALEERGHIARLPNRNRSIVCREVAA